MHDIVSEPSGPVYRSLLAFAEERSSLFSLVWRRQLAFDASADALAASLRPHLDSETETSAWPGTELLGHTAIVRRYRFSSDSRRLLASAERLYAWLAPQRPEDLAFYTKAGRCWLGSIAHERDAYVDLEPAELELLRAAVPGLDIR